MTSITGYEFIELFESHVPTWLAEDGDPVGLHLGDLSRPVRRILVTLDVRPEVVQEAIEKKADFIFSHPPPIYRPLKNLDVSDKQTKMYVDLLKHDISVYAAHTNLDNANNGMNDWLSEALGLLDVEIMDVTKRVPVKKISVCVPNAECNRVRLAMADAGAGNISDEYSHCSFEAQGVGRFTPMEGAKPAIGHINEPEEVQEKKIEMIVEDKYLADVLEALYEAHPYEEPVYEVYTINNFQREYGLGRVGNLALPMSLRSFIQYVKDVFQIEGMRFIAADLDQTISRVAVCGGDAGKYYRKAIKKGADVYITGDVYYHTAHDMQADGLTVIDPGHHIEQICKPKLLELFTEWKKENEWDLEVIASEINTDPFIFDSQL